MIIIKTEKIDLPRVSGQQMINYLLECNDEDYNKWWPGVHLKFRVLKHYPDHLGDVIFIDEFVGKYRVKMKNILIDLVSNKKVTFQVKKIIKLPIWWSLEFEDNELGTNLTHEIRVGYNGAGKILDPIFKIYFSRNFERSMDEHAKIEFQKLRDSLCVKVNYR